jgi:hypothetical protein
VTIMLIFGPWGGVGIRRSGPPNLEAFRLCLGWVALEVWRVDMEVWAQSMWDALRCLREAKRADWPRGIHSDLAQE